MQSLTAYWKSIFPIGLYSGVLLHTVGQTMCIIFYFDLLAGMLAFVEHHVFGINLNICRCLQTLPFSVWLLGSFINIQLSSGQLCLRALHLRLGALFWLVFTTLSHPTVRTK